MTNDGELFSPIWMFRRTDRYSVGNAILITAQKPDTTQAPDFKGWKDNGVYIKGESGNRSALEPGEEYTRMMNGPSVELQFKKVFDITPTNAKPREKRRYQA